MTNDNGTRPEEDSEEYGLIRDAQAAIGRETARTQLTEIKVRIYCRPFDTEPTGTGKDDLLGLLDGIRRAVEAKTPPRWDYEIVLPI